MAIRLLTTGPDQLLRLQITADKFIHTYPAPTLSKSYLTTQHGALRIHSQPQHLSISRTSPT
jgi:hypothetical protein